jgi:energy-coupling factor transporter ATP-binding protein EcfA2
MPDIEGDPGWWDDMPEPVSAVDPKLMPPGSPEYEYWQKQVADETAARRQREQDADTDFELRRLRARKAAEQQFALEQAELAKAAASEAARVHDGADFLLDLPPTPPARWGKGEDILWAEGEALMIAGPQGVGKTTIAGQLLRACIGIGDDVLGMPVRPTDNRVLYLAMDRPEQARRNLARMFVGDVEEYGREYLAEMLRFWSGPPPTDLAVDPEGLVRLARQHGADVIFVDSLKDAAVGLSKDEVGAGYNRARQMALAEGVQVVELHHTVKNGADGGKPNNINGIYGSTWLTSGCGSVVLLWGEPGDPIVDFVHLKQPMNEVGPWKVKHNRDTGRAEVFHDPDTDVLALARRCATTGLSANEAANCIFGVEKATKAQDEKARRKLNQMVRSGVLVERTGTKGAGSATRWFAAAPSSWIDEEESDERYP